MGKLEIRRPTHPRPSFMTLMEEQRKGVAKQGETELRTGLELMGRDKKAIQELIALVDHQPNNVVLLSPFYSTQ